MMPGRLQAIEATDPRRVSASRTASATGIANTCHLGGTTRYRAVLPKSTSRFTGFVRQAIASPRRPGAAASVVVEADQGRQGGARRASVDLQTRKASPFTPSYWTSSGDWTYSDGSHAVSQELSSTIQIVGAAAVEISPPLGRAPWADESISRVGADHLLTILNARN